MNTEPLKVDIKTSSPESATFIIRNEDHTLGNAVRYMLAKNPEVELAGYSVPHPSEPVMNLRVQTKGNISAPEALGQGLKDLKSILAHILEVYEVERQMFTPDDMDIK